MRRWLYAYALAFRVTPRPAPFSRLCIRCRAQGYILPADDASRDTCRAHLAEDRINELLKTGGW